MGFERRGADIEGTRSVLIMKETALSRFDRKRRLLSSAAVAAVVWCGVVRQGMVMCARLLGESASCVSPFAVVGHDSGHLCVYDLRATSAEPLLESRLHKAPCKRWQ